MHPCSRYILVALIAFLLHFPLHFPLHFILDPDTPVGTRSIPRSDRSNVSDFPTFVGRVRSQGFKGRSRFDSCLETELGVRFPIPTGFGCEVGRVGSKVKPGLDPTGIHYCLLIDLIELYIMQRVQHSLLNITIDIHQHQTQIMVSQCKLMH